MSGYSPICYQEDTETRALSMVPGACSKDFYISIDQEVESSDQK